MNNKVLLLNMQNIQEVILLDEACDPPSFTNWDESVDFGEIPLVVYEALEDFDPYYGRDVSDEVLSPRFQAILEELIKRENWSEETINAMIHETVVYYKDGRTNRIQLYFEKDETVVCEVSHILEFGDEIPATQMLRCETIEGIKVFLNTQSIALLAMPLLNVEDAICSYREDE